MDNNIDFRSIWKQQDTGSPDIAGVRDKLKRFRKSQVRNLIVANLCLIATSGFILFVWYYFQPQFISTKIGIVVTILAMAVFLLVYNQQIPVFRAIDEQQSSSDYLSQLIRLKEKQKFMQHTMMNLYFLLLSLGIGLYLYEYTSRMTLTWGIVTYLVTGAWLGFNWFVIKPKTTTKQQAKLNDLIDHLKQVSHQMEEGKR